MFDRKRPGGFPVAFSMPPDFLCPEIYTPESMPWNLYLEFYTSESRRGVRMGESGSEDSRGVMPGGTWPLKVGCYLYIQPVTKLSFSRVFLRALARRFKF